jgi:septal ring factor EnvC (AmiA/AmiB activator)
MVRAPLTQTPIEKFIVGIGSIPSLIIHTAVFASFFGLSLLGLIKWELMLLILTTALSLEAIYLAIFIQMTVNRNTQSLREVEEDIDEIQEDVDEIQEDVEELGEDMDEIQEDIEEMSEDLEELSEEDKAEELRDTEYAGKIEHLTSDIRRILMELESLKR